MARLIYLELLDPRGQTRSRVRLDAFPATIGRGYDNDVIVDDPYVCPRHARVHMTGGRGVVVEDAGSVNGVHGANGGGRQARLPLQPGDTFRIGRTLLRICDDEWTVAPAVVDHDGPGARLPRLLTTRSSLVIVALSFAAFAMAGWLASYERVSLAQVLSDALPAPLLFALWGGAWALVTRIITHRFNFAQHVAIVAGIGAVGLVVDAMTEWLTFLFASDDFTALWVLLAMLATVTMLYGHLSFATNLTRRRRWAISSLTVVTFFALATFVSLADEDDHSLGLDYPGALKPLSPRWLRSVTIDDFAKASESLKASVDSLAEE